MSSCDPWIYADLTFFKSQSCKVPISANIKFKIHSVSTSISPSFEESSFTNHILQYAFPALLCPSPDRQQLPLFYHPSRLEHRLKHCCTYQHTGPGCVIHLFTVLQAWKLCPLKQVQDSVVGTVVIRCHSRYYVASVPIRGPNPKLFQLIIFGFLSSEMYSKLLLRKVSQLCHWID